MRNFLRRMRRPASLALVLGGIALTSPLGAEPRLAMEPLAWTGLDFEASGWLGRVRAEVRLSPGAGEPAPPPAGPIPASRDDWSWIADLTTRVDPLLVARRTSAFRAWFDPADGSVAGVTKLSLGPRPDRKIYRFDGEGAHRVRIEPRSGEADGPHEGWSQVVESFHGFRADDLGCRVVSDPAVLVYKISRMARPGDRELSGHCVFSGKTLFKIDVARLGLRRLRVDYRVRGADGPLRHRGRVRAEGFRVHAWPVAGELDEDDVELDLYVEEGTRIPVQVTTRVDVLGEIDVRLDEVIASPEARDRRADAPGFRG